MTKYIEHLMVLAWTLYLLILDIKDYEGIEANSLITLACLIAAILISAVIYYLIGFAICIITRNIYEKFQKSKS